MLFCCVLYGASGRQTWWWRSNLKEKQRIHLKSYGSAQLWWIMNMCCYYFNRMMAEYDITELTRTSTPPLRLWLYVSELYVYSLRFVLRRKKTHPWLSFKTKKKKNQNNQNCWKLRVIQFITMIFQRENAGKKLVFYCFHRFFFCARLIIFHDTFFWYD